MLLLPRLRVALARRPWMYWLFVAACAAFVWSTLASAQARLNKQREQWGQTRRVWVAAADISAGDVVRVIARDYPVAMVPESALTDEPADATASAAIAAGEVLVTADVSPTERSLPVDWVVFALATDGAPTLRRGDQVAIFGSGQRWCDGVVVALAEDAIEVGVPPECADAVSAQAALDAVVLASLRTG